MTIPQISVFLENKAGQLADITGILSENQINMRAINIAETADYGVLRLIVDDAPRASSILLDQNSQHCLECGNKSLLHFRDLTQIVGKVFRRHFHHHFDRIGVVDTVHNDLIVCRVSLLQKHGVLRLIVDDAPRASSILLDQGFILTMTSVVGVAVPDTPGGLSRVLEVISHARIDVEYMYSVFGQKDGQACMIFRVEDTDGLASVLEDNGIGTISGEDLGLH